MNCHRDGACVVSDGDYIFAITGFDGNGYLDTMEVYDPCKNVWKTEGTLSVVMTSQKCSRLLGKFS